MKLDAVFREKKKVSEKSSEIHCGRYRCNVVNRIMKEGLCIHYANLNGAYSCISIAPDKIKVKDVKKFNKISVYINNSNDKIQYTCKIKGVSDSIIGL